MEIEVERRPVASRSRAAGHHVEGEPVVLADIDIPFERMVAFMVKWALASIPAALILTVVACVVAWILATAVLALGWWP